MSPAPSPEAAGGSAPAQAGMLRVVRRNNEPAEAPSSVAGPLRRTEEAPSAPADFGEVVSRYETPLLRYLGRIAEPDEAEDIAQEAFIRLHRELGRSAVANVGGFLFRAAHNLALDQRRRRRARSSLRERAARELAQPDEDSPEGLAAVIRRAACEKALEELGKLPPRQKRVLLLKVIQDFTLREIAEITGTTAGNAAHHLNAGLAELARRLKAAGVI